MRDSEDFTAAVRRGRKAGTSTVVVHALRDGDREPTVGFVVSKAVGGAVVRNRVKRRLRHVVAEQHVDALGRGGRIVVRALPASATASSARLAADLSAALQRAGAL